MSALARFASFARPAGPPLLRAPPRPAVRAAVAALADAAIAAGGLEAAIRLLAAASPAAAGEAAPPPPRWAEVVRPIALYDLPGTAFSRLPLRYRARRLGDDGPREDVMTFGALGEGTPFLQLSLLRAGPAPEPDRDGLADGLARLAGVRGLTATRLRPGGPIEARLGRFETADLLLWDRGAPTGCLGFRGGPDGGAVLRVSGFACGTPGRPIDRAALGCALDRLDLVRAGEDGALRAAFVAGERRATAAGCAGVPALLGRRPGWLDAEGEAPPLRGLFEAGARGR